MDEGGDGDDPEAGWTLTPSEVAVLLIHASFPFSKRTWYHPSFSSRMAREVPFVSFPTTLYFIPGPSRKLAVAHATWVLGRVFGGGGGEEEVFGVSTTGDGGGGEVSLGGSTDFLRGGGACFATGAGWDRFIDFSNSVKKLQKHSFPESPLAELELRWTVTELCSLTSLISTG